jgi:hypothetical protein
MDKENIHVNLFFIKFSPVEELKIHYFIQEHK